MSADDEVIRRAKRGEPEAWRELYRAHAGRLIVWLGRRPSGDVVAAPEDLAADAWLVAAEKIADFTGTAEEFAGWLFGIARHLAANSQRRAHRRATEPTSELPERTASVGPEPELVARDWVARLLASLPDRERDVVACRDVVGLDVAATARALDMSQVAVRVAHHRALRRLRKQQATPPVTPPVG